MILRILATLAAGLMLAACTGPGQPAPSSTPGSAGPTLPPRPREVRLDGIDPCALLTDEQLRQLGVGYPGPTRNSDDGPGCQWSNPVSDAREGYLVRLRPRQGAAASLVDIPGVRVVTVAGFAAIETYSQFADTQRHCIVVIDSASGQSIDVQYDKGGQQPINRELACRKATVAAELVIQDLQAR